VKKIIFFISAAAIWWLLFFRLGESPRLFRLFMWAESPLIIKITSPEKLSIISETSGKIELNEFGVPRIQAQNENDAAYLLGWMHGCERRFQMEMIRRTVQGTLCEVVGEKALSSDLFWRRFQFSKKWRAWYAQQPKALKSYFQAYAKGINDQWQQQKSCDKPIEFFILDFEPNEFQEQDLFYLLRYMDYSLNYDEGALALQETKNLLPKEVFDLFYPKSQPIQHPILSNPVSIEHLHSNQEMNQTMGYFAPTSGIDWMEPSGKTETGSNNWAVGKWKMTEGNAALSNDPHLKLQLPNTWYEAIVETPLGKKAGFTLPGSPFIISGNNDSIAWGITNATWSLTHFFPVSQISKNRVAINQKIIPTRSEKEIIEIRGNSPLEISVQKCEYGIVDTLRGQKYLIQWIGNAPVKESNEALTFWGLEHSNSIEDAEKALQHYGHPPQNFVIADHSGNVFQATCGFFGSTFPTSPTPWIKAQTVLKEKNPPRGFIFSANQAQSSHSSIHGISNSFAPEARAKGIENGLGQPSLSPQNLIALQTKIVDEEWSDFKARFLSKIPRSYPDLKKEMTNWDGEMSESSVSAAFFSVVRTFLHRELIATCLGDVPFAPHSDHLNALLLQHEWVKGKKQLESVSKIWERSMILGIDSLIRLNGKNWRNWTYGKIHQAEVQHITKIPALGGGKWTFNGSPRSVNVLRIGKGIHGASMRNTVIFNPSGFIRYSINFGGQSGRCFSPHYIDQIQPWRDGLYRKQISSTFKSRMVYEFHP